MIKNLVLLAMLAGLATWAARQDGDMRSAWAYDLATRLGNPAPTHDTISLIVAWTKAEDGGTGAFGRNNPLNTTETGGAIQTINSDGVRGYATYEDGMTATIQTLRYKHAGYSEIVSGIQSNDTALLLAGLYASPWGTDMRNVETIWEETQAGTQTRVSSSDDIRTRVIQLALSQVGKPYILGASGPNAFDCSGLVQWVYAQQGIDTGRTTFDQLPRLRPISPDELRTGDMVYFQFSWDQHTGILADVNGDGRWDMINAGTPQIGVVVTDDVFSDPFWTNAIIGYRSAIQ